MRFLVIVLMILGFMTLVPTDKVQGNEIHQSIPDNDLWKEDCLGCKDNKGIDEAMFDKIIDLGAEAYKAVADQNQETIQINHKWEDATVNANCTRYGSTVEINMFGGLARRDEITPEGFALVLCHELNHAYGGAPYIRAYNQLSAEGQADYMGAKVCLAKVLKALDIEYGRAPTEFMQNVCANQKICVGSLVGGQSLGELLAVITKVPVPDYQTPDPTIVPKTLLSYPKTIQCRLDTYLRGALSKERPACWFKN